MRRAHFTLLFLLVPFIQIAQVTISGTVKDDVGAIEFANVIISTSGQSITGGVTNIDGYFSIEIPPGTYDITISFISYKTFDTQLTVDADRNLGEIILEVDNAALGEVIVTSKKKIFRKDGDKLVMNIASNELFEGKNTVEVLKYAPYLVIDSSNGSISMKGASTTVMIDGIISQMTQSDLNNFLSSMPSSQIKSIEIISNPSAKYDASGNGGLINIITTSAKQRGLSGTFNSRADMAVFTSANMSLNLNVNITKYLSLNSYTAYNQSRNLSNEQRNESLEQPSVDYNYVKIDTSRSEYIFLSKNLQYLKNNHRVRLGITGLDQDGSRKQTNDLTIVEPDLTFFSLGDYDLRSHRKFYNLNLNYELTFDDKAQNIDFLADYYNSDFVANNFYINDFFGEGNENQDNIRRSVSPVSNIIFSGQVDYSLYWKQINFQSGVKISDVTSKNNTEFENLIDGDFVLDTSLSNNFNYRENIYAGYVTVSKDSLFKKDISVKAGLRVEYTKGEGEIIGDDTIQNRAYIDLFPSIFINKSIGENASLNVSYSRRINRPNYRSFNPTIFYLTDFTSQVGNPELQPAYTNAFEVGYNLPNLSVLLFYNNTSGEAREILERLGPETLRYQWRNIDQSNVYGTSVSGNQKITKWLRVIARGSYYIKNYLSTFEGDIDNIDVEKGTFQGRLALAFNFKNNFNSDIAFEYNGPETFGQFSTGENYAFYINLSKRINKNLLLSLNITDPFDNLRFRFTNEQQEIVTTQIRNNFSRTFSFVLNYNFELGVETKNINTNNSNRDLRNRTN